MSNYLDQINQTGDIRKIPRSALPELAKEIRAFLIEKVSVTGGHLASNLGTVELTMGLHLALDLPEDKIVWDVGHQSYTHKILTGRKAGFDTLRQYGGMAGFPKRAESDTDVFDTGHASDSISAGLGMVKARDLLGGHETIVAVIGDGSLTGGLAYEGLNNAARLDTNFIIVLNDNNRSISENVGGMSHYLERIRTSTTYLDLRDKVYNSLKDRSPQAVERIRKAKNTFKSTFLPGMLFENLGITYLGPIDGMNPIAVRDAIGQAKNIRKAVVVHVITKKGEGYLPAENHPARFHGTAPFEIETGLPKKSSKVSYTDIFSTVMIKMAQRDPAVVAITAAMADGTGLRRFHNIYPHRFFDVGIAEEHAVTFAAGLAASGMKPVVAIYSTFLQRAFDEIAMDVCMQDLPVVFCIDRAGLVGADGETHQGIFDLSYLSAIPNMTITAPKNKWELSDLIKFALKFGHPIAIRYPKGCVYDGLREVRERITYGKSELVVQGTGILLYAVGSMVETAVEVRELLMDPEWVEAHRADPPDRGDEPFEKAREEESARAPYDDNVSGERNNVSGERNNVSGERDNVSGERDKGNKVKGTDEADDANGLKNDSTANVTVHVTSSSYDPTIVNARFVQPFDTEMLEKQLPAHRLLVTMEENVYSGGFGEHVEAWVTEHRPGQKVLRIAVPDVFVQHGAVDILKKKLRLDAESVAERILEALTGN